jgi:predicted nucleic-acid-binding Zn-ribbon protein
MPLTNAQKAIIEEWLNSRANRFACPGCGGKKWCIQDELAFPQIIYTGSHKINPEGGFPLAVITCNHCGYTSFFSALQIGLMKQH